MSLDCFLGFDGGGSKTAATLIGPDGKVLGRFTGGPSNSSSDDLNTTRRSLRSILENVGSTLGDDRLCAVSMASAGISNRTVREELSAVLSSVFPGSHIVFSGDNRIALYSCFPSGEGIVLMSGTGSMCYAVDGGREYRAGGWGGVISDEGSGYDIGRMMLRRVSQVFDSGEESPLYEALAERCSLYSREDISSFANGPGSKQRLCSLAPLLDEYALSGMDEALEIVHAAAAGLAGLVRTVLGRIGHEPSSIGLFGSILIKSEPVRNEVCHLLDEYHPGIRTIMPDRSADEVSALIAKREYERLCH